MELIKNNKISNLPSIIKEKTPKFPFSQEISLDYPQSYPQQK